MHSTLLIDLGQPANLPEFVDICVYHQSSDEEIIPHLTIPKSDVREIRNQLLKALTTYQITHKNGVEIPEPARFRSLVTTCSLAFEHLLELIDENAEQGNAMYGKGLRDYLVRFTATPGNHLSVTTRGLILPFELLYLDDPALTSVDPLGGFLGLRLSIDYNYLDLTANKLPQTLDDNHIYTKRSSFVGFIGAELDHAEDEGSYLETLFKGSMEDSQSVSSLESDDEVLKHWAGNNRMHIAHFMCHHYFSDDISELKLGPAYKFNTYHMRALRRSNPLRPLVFVNACKSLPIDLKYGYEIPKLLDHFYPFCSRGLILSFVDVKDVEAAEVAKRFYHYLLEGSNVSDALFKARIDSKENHPRMQAIISLAFTLVCTSPRIRLVTDDF